MTAHTDLPNSLFLQDKPILGSTGMALRDNVAAAAEAATGAPVLVAGWHPYDMVKIGDGNDGVFYDFAVHGTRATIMTPDFADGYEYAVMLEDLGCNATSKLVVSLYKETDAAYQAAWTSTNTTSGAVYGWFPIVIPRVAKNVHTIEYHTALNTMPNTVVEVGMSGMYDATIQKILRARFAWYSGNIDAGKAKLYRRGMQG